MRLRRVTCQGPGWHRVKQGRGFRYLDQDGGPLEPEDVVRCKNLVIPPAWKDVWICPHPNGHLQAVGTDDAGRRQYLYHPDWRTKRDLEKFERIELFAATLVKRRAATRRDLSAAPGEELGRTQVVAAAFALLDLGIFRIGSERYTEENGSYGLTTIERDHVTPHGRAALDFHYVGKSGQDVEVTVRDKRVVAVLRDLIDRDDDDPRLLAFREDDAWHHVDASDVNAYVKAKLGDDHTAKDFRTWRGTVIAALALAGSAAGTKTARKRAITAAMREVSDHLGNTPAVARSSYVDPRVVDLFEDGQTVSPDHRRVSPGGAVGRALERDVLALLQKA
nr:DNA topoisomerase IB [Aeromicrobium massiliense]